MALSTAQDKEYQQAQTAYMQGNYEEAAKLVDQLVQHFPEDPSSRLLQGHIYYVLQQYDVAREQYHMVLNLTEDAELIDCANKGLESVSQYDSEQSASNGEYKETQVTDTFGHTADSSEWSNYRSTREQPDLEDLSMLEDFDSNSFDLKSFEHDEKSGAGLEPSFNNLFGTSKDFAESHSAEETSLDSFADPFDLNEAHDAQAPGANGYKQQPNEFLGNGANGRSTASFESDSSSFEQAELPPTHWFESELQLDDEDQTLLLKTESGTAFALEEPHTYRLASSSSQNGFHREDSSDLNVFDIGEGANASEGNANHIAEAGWSKINFLEDSSGNLLLKETTPTFTQVDAVSTPSLSVKSGRLAFFQNASLARKQLYIAGAVGVISAVVVAGSSLIGAMLVPQQSRADVQNVGGAMAVAALIASGGTTLFLGRKQALQIQQTTVDLKGQFDAVRGGNLNAKATVHSADEFGQLASGFNEMTRVIFKTTSEAQRKAEEQEQAKEDLQRQVIRLLDDVEGAARGDLTVQAEVSADVLGAVADSFNLTIQNLREIVQQVKLAARHVSKGATDSETFARALSSDALRQAEELAVTLNSVQVMTNAIQRVAESAREAESVALSASDTAKKGGEAVERTVAGILEIRQTVAQTTRKVKRLAESSQEISKIVALISQIASRTNMLALNASIEAARAGESGRGFAIVADEVRQLADRVAKALKEIEQLVRQIQSETGSVMTAMEEGTQQVIQGTHLAEQAKRSLDDILQVSNRIDVLVRSITADTVQQTESSRAVAAVMQSVELTAQETSQEAQRVSGSLQSLAGVAGNMLTFVERFRVETKESM